MDFLIFSISSIVFFIASFDSLSGSPPLLVAAHFFLLSLTAV